MASLAFGFPLRVGGILAQDEASDDVRKEMERLGMISP